jgi:hypothetical protein
MPTIDYKKELKHLYAPSAKNPVLVEVPPLHYLMIDGQGDPNSAPAYAAAVEALYALAYALKFMVKREQSVDYGVMPLEGLWWGQGIDWHDSSQRAGWQWTMMIMQPDYVTAALFEQAVVQTRKKKPGLALDHVRFERYDEGRAGQIMHIGPSIARRADRGTAACVYRAAGPRATRQAPRDLPGRSAQDRARKAAHGDPPADGVMRWAEQAGRSSCRQEER